MHKRLLWLTILLCICLLPAAAIAQTPLSCSDTATDSQTAVTVSAEYFNIVTLEIFGDITSAAALGAIETNSAINPLSCLLIAIGTAYFICKLLTKKYKSDAPAYHYDYTHNGNLELTSREDTFIGHYASQTPLSDGRKRNSRGR